MSTHVATPDRSIESQRTAFHRFCILSILYRMNFKTAGADPKESIMPDIADGKQSRFKVPLLLRMN